MDNKSHMFSDQVFHAEAQLTYGSFSPAYFVHHDKLPINVKSWHLNQQNLKNHIERELNNFYLNQVKLHRGYIKKYAEYFINCYTYMAQVSWRKNKMT